MKHLPKFISLVSDISDFIAVLMIAGLLFEVIGGSERYDRMLFLGVMAALLLLVGYMTRRAARRMGRRR
jgi:hypothetical protein